MHITTFLSSIMEIKIRTYETQLTNCIPRALYIHSNCHVHQKFLLLRSLSRHLLVFDSLHRKYRIPR